MWVREVECIIHDWIGRSLQIFTVKGLPSSPPPPGIKRRVPPPPPKKKHENFCNNMPIVSDLSALLFWHNGTYILECLGTYPMHIYRQVSEGICRVSLDYSIYTFISELRFYNTVLVYNPPPYIFLSHSPVKGVLDRFYWAQLGLDGFQCPGHHEPVIPSQWSTKGINRSRLSCTYHTRNLNIWKTLQP